MPSIPPLHLLQSFVLVVQRASFTAAAQRQGLSKAAVSKQVRELEAMMGMTLLERTTRSLSLTEGGRELYERAVVLLEELQSLEEIAAKWRQEPRGTLRVFAAGQLGVDLILPLVPLYLGKYPAVQLHLDLDERIPDMQADKLDIVVGLTMSGADSLIQRTILQTRYVLCAAPTYLKSHGAPRRPRDLCKHRYITHSMRRPDDQLVFKDELTVTLEPYLRVNNVRAIVTLAEQGLGIINVHDYAVNAAIAAGRLTPLLQDFQKPSTPVYVWVKPFHLMPPRVRCFLDMLYEAARAQPASRSS